MVRALPFGLRLVLTLGVAFTLAWACSCEAKIHALVVADTESPTARAAEEDSARVYHELRRAADYLDEELQFHLISGDELQADRVMCAMDALQVSGQDMVVFYYLGHGFRTLDKRSPWPYLYLSQAKQGLDTSLLVETLIEKRPKWGLVVTDCCNNEESLLMWQGLFGFSSESHPSNDQLRKGYRALLNQFSGIVCVSASTPGELAYCSSKGHLFTQAFWWSLHKELTQQSPSWEALLDRCARQLSRFQTPYFEILYYPE